MVFLLTEDSTSGKDFWGCACLLRWNSISVESKGNAYELVKYVEKIINNITDKFIIALDYVYDNLGLMRNYYHLLDVIAGHDNFILLNIICFEQILLSCDKLLTYIDNQCVTCDGLLVSVRESLLNAIASGEEYSSDTLEYVDVYRKRYKRSKQYTVESLSSSILKRLTENTGYYTDKSVFGSCWLSTCCGTKYGNCDRGVTALDKLEELINTSDFGSIASALDSI